MARHFAATLDKYDCGDPAATQSLANASTLAVFCAGTRDADEAKSFITKSDAASTGGWEFAHGNPFGPGFNTYGHIRAIIWTDATHWDFISGADDSSTDTVPGAGEEYFFGFQWDGSGCEMWLGPQETPVSQVGTVTVNTSGSGTPNTDVGQDLIVGNLTRAADQEHEGDLSFVTIYGRSDLTDDNVRTIQLGINTFMAGDTTRGVAIMKSITGYKLLAHIEDDGTFTDYSGNGITGARTGTTSSSDPANYFAPTAFEDDSEEHESSDIREQTTYRYTGSFAQKGYTTTATEATAWMQRVGLSGLDAQAKVGVLIDGAYTDTLVAAAAGVASDSITGMAGSSKEVHFVNGARSRPGALPVDGTYVTLVHFNAAATEITPPTRSKRLTVFGESIIDGFMSATPPSKAAAQQYRLLTLSSDLDAVAQAAYGSMNIADLAGTAGLRTNTAGVATGLNSRVVVIALGGNDKLNDIVLATFQTQYQALLEAVLNADEFVRVMGLGMTVFDATSEGVNGNGDTADDFRTAISDAVDAANTAVGGTRASYENAKSVYTTGELADAVHPTDAGHDLLYAWLDPLVDTAAAAAAADVANSLSGDTPGALLNFFW